MKMVSGRSPFDGRYVMYGDIYCTEYTVGLSASCSATFGNFSYISSNFFRFEQLFAL